MFTKMATLFTICICCHDKTITMLTPEELITYKKKSALPVMSLGQKESDFCATDTKNLDIKLANMEQLLSVQRVKMMGQLSKGIWRPDVGKAEIIEKIGPFWDTLGHYMDSRLFLYPEEALYLLDIAALELSFNGVPLSIKRGYFLLINEKAVSIDFYRVYAYLSLLGYKVIRHSTKNVFTKYEKHLEIHKIGIKHRDVITKPTTSVMDSSDLRIAGESDQPVLEIDAKSEELLSHLREVGPRSDDCEIHYPTRSPDFDVFQPASTQFRKSTIQLPNFRVMTCNSNEPVPSFEVICDTEKAFKDDVPLILAIVYPDFINFLQISSVNLPTLK